MKRKLFIICFSAIFLFFICSCADSGDSENGEKPDAGIALYSLANYKEEHQGESFAL